MSLLSHCCNVTCTYYQITVIIRILSGLKRFSLIQLPELLNNISIKMLMAALKLELDGQAIYRITIQISRCYQQQPAPRSHRPRGAGAGARASARVPCEL